MDVTLAPRNVGLWNIVWLWIFMKICTNSGGGYLWRKWKIASHRIWAWTEPAVCVEGLLLVAHSPCGFSISAVLWQLSKYVECVVRYPYEGWIKIASFASFELGVRYQTMKLLKHLSCLKSCSADFLNKTNQPNKFTQTATKTTQQPTDPHYKQKITRTTQLELVTITWFWASDPTILNISFLEY